MTSAKASKFLMFSTNQLHKIPDFTRIIRGFKGHPFKCRLATWVNPRGVRTIEGFSPRRIKIMQPPTNSIPFVTSLRNEKI